MASEAQPSMHQVLGRLEREALGPTARVRLEPSTARMLERGWTHAVSVNEELDDLSVFALRCLIVPYYLALFHDAQGGLDGKRRGVAYYDAFLDGCLRHGVLEPKVRGLVEACVEAGEVGEGGEDGEDGGGGALGESRRQISREQKVEMFKVERQLAKSVSGHFLIAEKAGTRKDRGDAGSDDGNAGDDQDIRPIYLMMISQFAIKACNARQLVQQEVEMLAAVAAMPEDARMQMVDARQERARESERVMGKLREAVRGLGGGLDNKNKKEQLRAGVFKPSHILPTMTVEQFGEMEMARMGQEEERKRRIAAEARVSRAQSLKGKAEQEAEEALALQKARAWDDFKDDNKRGSGNSKLRNTR